MTITNCPNCGGIHYGSHTCPYTSAPCSVCNTSTIYACSDCAIDGKGSVHVCEKRTCQDTHERRLGHTPNSLQLQGHVAGDPAARRG